MSEQRGAHLLVHVGHLEMSFANHHRIKEHKTLVQLLVEVLDVLRRNLQGMSNVIRHIQHPIPGKLLHAVLKCLLAADVLKSECQRGGIRAMGERTICFIR